MTRILLVVFLLGGQCLAELPPVEGENGPAETPWPGWDKRTAKPIAKRDNTYGEWHYKFITATDKQLGSALDVTLIRSEVPIPDPTIRWVSRSLALAAGNKNLYVIEKHHSKWEITHRFEGIRLSPPAIR